MSNKLSNPVVKLGIILLLILITIFYVRAFFTTGMYYDQSFLQKNTNGSASQYIGKNDYGEFYISVFEQENNNTVVTYQLPNNISETFTVSFREPEYGDVGIESITDSQGTQLFDGEYSKEQLFLYDETGNPFIEDDAIIQIRVNRESPYQSGYVIPLKNVVDVAYFANDTIRGKVELFILALFLFIITGIDFKFPLLFFKLRYFLYVRDPEPSYLYIMMQKISRYVLLTAGVILLILAI
ncbi:hypothetical protein [Bacillus alkalicellulosilyticus]|uniref:hypothetical protein n=1 Tax=Alkalihalobacterium alkalicellulosilyticum TaxID=1912214 RepID=UPI0009987954|nr:hypothetical protein [Bacillus alkalicellulosilyticus]